MKQKDEQERRPDKPRNVCPRDFSVRRDFADLQFKMLPENKLPAYFEPEHQSLDIYFCKNVSENLWLYDHSLKNSFWKNLEIL